MVILLKNLLFTVLVPGTVAVYLPLALARGRSCASGPTAAVGVVLLLLGGLVYAWCVWDFARFGRGTPAPIDAPKRLVVRGLYRCVRNPMYVGVLGVIGGWSLLYAAPRLLLYAAFVATCFHGFIVLHEEPHLLAEFGEEYEAYRSRLPRWLPRRSGSGSSLW